MSERTNQYLRGSRKLTEQGIVFFEEFGKGLKEKANSKVKLLNYIRPLQSVWKPLPDRVRGIDTYLKHEPEPIVIFPQDFIEKTKQKFRMGNRFMFYAAKYLIDHQLVPDWYWEVEKFEMEERKTDSATRDKKQKHENREAEESLVKIKEFHKRVPDEYRLSIENDHVTIGILKGTNHEIFNGKEKHKSFYQFTIGPKAMRYLLALHIQKPEADLNSFLALAMKEDMEELTKNAWAGERNFKLLEEIFLPEYLKTEKNTDDLAAHITKLKNRISYIKTEWQKALQNKTTLRRTDKNRIIMQGYRLFDWEVAGNVKFLRANEYNYLSVCHYSLKFKDLRPGEKRSKFDYLYHDLFQLSRRKPPIPKAIVTLLDEAANLDELLESVIKCRQKYLKEKMDTIEILPNKPKKEAVIELSRKLGLSIPNTILGITAKEEIDAKHSKTLEVLPFAIHPVLLIKYLAPELYIKGNEQINGIFRKMREPAFSEGLYSAHYDIAYLDKMIDSEQVEVVQAFEKQKNKWIGIVNSTLTEDSILWQIAKFYLKNNDFTAKMALALQKNQENLTVGSLYGEEIIMELTKVNNNRNEDDVHPKPIYLSMMMHQIDDIMYATEKEKLRRAAVHYLGCNTKEKEFWEEIAKQKVQNSLSAIADEQFYDGSKESPIPYEILRREIRLIADGALHFAKTLLDWEIGVLELTLKDKNLEERQTWLIANCGKVKKYADFNNILSWAGITNELLTRYRNSSFHDGIPLKGSYLWMLREGSELYNLLGLQKPIVVVKDRRQYLKK